MLPRLGYLARSELQVVGHYLIQCCGYGQSLKG